MAFLSLKFYGPKTRLDKFIREQVGDVSRNQLKKAITSGLVSVNGSIEKTPHRFLKTGDTVEMERGIQISKTKELEPVVGELEVLYEDSDLLAVNKPAGLVVHPAAGNKTGTLINILIHMRPELKEVVIDKESPVSNQRLGLIHRLDKETSGVILIAKNLKTLSHLAKQIKNRQVTKTYQTLLWGNLEEGRLVNKPLARHLHDRKRMVVKPSGRESITYFKPLEYFLSDSEEITYCQAEPYTGRTHQIRVHALAINHPVLGDSTYFNKQSLLLSKSLSLPRQMLHAGAITFLLPTSKKEITVTAPLPEDFKNVLKRLKKEGRK